MRSVLIGLVLTSILSASPVVNRPVVNMHSAPTEDSDVVSQARFAEAVTVLEASAEWLKVRTPDDYTGWVPSAALIARETPYEANAAVAQLYAHVYRESSIIKHAPLLTLPFETRLQVRDSVDERWLEVTLPDGRSGSVQRGDVTFDLHPIQTSAMLELSRRFLGLPYTWGGTSSFGYDCSGFTQMLLRQRGIVIPRDAHQQAAWEGVKTVEKADLEGGDLLFFGPSPEKITHTGMYLDSGQFIHATAHLKPVIQISNLHDPHWTELYLSARRPR